MSALPLSVARTEVAELSGGEVKVRGLTILEVRYIRSLSENDADVHAVALGCGLADDDARAWFEQASAGDLEEMMRAIFTASGLDKKSRFPGRTSDDAGPERAGQ